MSICSGPSRTFALRRVVAAMLSEISLDDLESTGSGTPLPRESSERLHESSLPSKTCVQCGCCTHFVTPTQKVSKSSPCVRGLLPSKSLVFTFSFFCIVFVPILFVPTISKFSLSSPCNQLVDRASATRHNTFVSILANSHHHDASRHFQMQSGKTN